MNKSKLKTIIDEINEKVNYEEILQKLNFDLEPHGYNKKMVCPFHNENTPSFIISDEKKILKCFGCGKSFNNIIYFIKEYYNISIQEAILKVFNIYPRIANKYSIEELELNAILDNVKINLDDFKKVKGLFNRFLLFFGNIIILNNNMITKIDEKIKNNKIKSEILKYKNKILLKSSNKFQIWNYDIEKDKILEPKYINIFGTSLNFEKINNNTSNKIYKNFKDLYYNFIYQKEIELEVAKNELIENLGKKYMSYLSDKYNSDKDTIINYLSIFYTDNFNVKNNVYITEGFFDAYNLALLGKVYYSSANLSKKIIEKLINNINIEAPNNIILAFDNDETGKKSAKILNKIFSGLNKINKLNANILFFNYDVFKLLFKKYILLKYEILNENNYDKTIQYIAKKEINYYNANGVQLKDLFTLYHINENHIPNDTIKKEIERVKDIKDINDIFKLLNEEITNIFRIRKNNELKKVKLNVIKKLIIFILKKIFIGSIINIEKKPELSKMFLIEDFDKNEEKLINEFYKNNAGILISKNISGFNKKYFNTNSSEFDFERKLLIAVLYLLDSSKNKENIKDILNKTILANINNNVLFFKYLKDINNIIDDEYKIDTEKKETEIILYLTHILYLFGIIDKIGLNNIEKKKIKYLYEKFNKIINPNDLIKYTNTYIKGYNEIIVYSFIIHFFKKISN